MPAFSRRRRRTAIPIAIALIAVLGLGIAVYLTVRTKGSPQQTATAFLTAWQRGDLSAMKAQVVEPPRDFDGIYNAFTKGSQAKRIIIQDIRVRPKAYLNFGETATYYASFTVTLDGPVPYTYDGQLQIIDFDRAWKVHWSPTAIHPQLQEVGFSEVRQIRVVPQRDGSSWLVLLETRAKGEQAGRLFADEGLKLAAILADSAQPGVTG